MKQTLFGVLVLALALSVSACGPEPRNQFEHVPESSAGISDQSAASSAEDEAAFLDQVQERTFRWFWDVTPPEHGLTPDRWPSGKSSSIAAVGFALTAYPIGVERGWITRDQARERTLNTLKFFHETPQGPEPEGNSGHRGFFYHFLDMKGGARYSISELSSIDTTLLLGGVLLAEVYFDHEDSGEREIRRLAREIYERVDWTFFQPDPPLVTMGWRPESGFGRAQWKGYDESMLLQVLALGSPTHPLGPELWEAYTSTNEWAEFHDQEHVNFAPLFGHQYSHVWIDFRGIFDDYMAERGIDYFENSRRATLAQKTYAEANPHDWDGYGGDFWGLTASDGPGGFRARIDGRERQFHGYWARGAAVGEIRDDGTLVPTAAGGSVPFAPEITIPALRAMAERYGEHLYTEYGFLDAFNPTLNDPALLPPGQELARGRIEPGVGWFNDDYLGIDQGPILLMIENHRTGMIWELMKESEPVVHGLCRAGFRRGWLEGKCEQ